MGAILDQSSHPSNCKSRGWGRGRKILVSFQEKPQNGLRGEGPGICFEFKVNCFKTYSAGATYGGGRGRGCGNNQIRKVGNKYYAAGCSRRLIIRRQITPSKALLVGGYFYKTLDNVNPHAGYNKDRRSQGRFGNLRVSQGIPKAFRLFNKSVGGDPKMKRGASEHFKYMGGLFSKTNIGGVSKTKCGAFGHFQQTGVLSQAKTASKVRRTALAHSKAGKMWHIINK